MEKLLHAVTAQTPLYKQISAPKQRGLFGAPLLLGESNSTHSSFKATNNTPFAPWLQRLCSQQLGVRLLSLQASVVSANVSRQYFVQLCAAVAKRSGHLRSPRVLQVVNVTDGDRCMRH